jgi:methionyl-tRNA formyltransferase
MKIVFAGTPEFAAQAMQAIHDAGHQIVLALTQPDRRAGRGMHLQASPVKVFANENNIPVLQPQTLRRDHADIQKQMGAQEAYQKLSTLDFDAMVVVAYGLILPQEILDITQRPSRYGSFNIHASLLPRWRGAAPIQRAIEAGDQKTGVCIMKMDAGLDTGDTVLVDTLDIAIDENSTTLHDRLASMGARLIVQTLNVLEKEKGLEARPQNSQGVIYAEKILKSEADIDWLMSAQEIDCRIRAFNPFPGAISTLQEQPLKCWNSRLAPKGSCKETKNIGEILGFSEHGAYVQCGSGVVEVLEMQRPGGKKMSAKMCLQAFPQQENGLRFQVMTQSKTL